MIEKKTCNYHWCEQAELSLVFYVEIMEGSLYHSNQMYQIDNASHGLELRDHVGFLESLLDKQSLDSYRFIKTINVWMAQGVTLQFCLP